RPEFALVAVTAEVRPVAWVIAEHMPELGREMEYVPPAPGGQMLY
ncbi:unnamed protein product, partial [marine sediment metagenome]